MLVKPLGGWAASWIRRWRQSSNPSCKAASPPERLEPLAIAIALAGLVVSASKAAWDVYRDLKKQKAAPAPDLLARRLRLEQKVDGNVSAEQRDKIIAVVLDEVI